MVELVEVEPGKWRVKRPVVVTARSALSLPNVISDIMEPTEQVDGRYYTSKREFRRAGQRLGLTEVGNEKFAPKVRSTDLGSVKASRKTTISNSVEKYRAGQRPDP